MDIYILHKGQESGPYSEKAVAQLLDQGSIAPSDFAWRQGWPDWRPLSEFLTVETASATDLPKPFPEEEVPAPAKAMDIKAAEDSPESKRKAGASLAEPVKSVDPAEPASAKQKALLTFLRITLPTELTKDQAARMINDVMEDPQHARRLSQWNEERFRLHPELFSAEIQAKKENRANHFFELCQTTGSEYFSGISKAHCQVLVSFLDVTYPHWDTPEADAAEHYFFPAVAEKFPQLVQKQWRGRLKYSDGVKVASEIKKSGTSKIRQTRTSPAAAVFKGTVIGLVILGALYLGHRTLRQEANAASTGEHAAGTAQNSQPGSPTTPASPALVPTLQPAPVTTDAPPTPPPLPSSAVAMPTALAPAAISPEPTADASSVAAPTVAVASPPGPSTPMGDANGVPPMTLPPSSEPVAPVAPPAPTFPVAGALPTTPATPTGSSEMVPPVLGPDPNAGPGSAIAGTAPSAPTAPSVPVVGEAPATVTATAKINLLLTKPVEIQLAYGKIMLPPGTPVKLMSRQGYLLKVAYQSSVITVPVGSTDLE